MKPMTLNTMLYNHVNEGMKVMSYQFKDLDILKEQPEQVETIPTLEEVQVPCYIQWQIFES